MNTDTLHSVTSKQMLAELYFSMDRITLAQQVLDSIAVRDTSEEAGDFISLMEIFIDLRQADTSLSGLDSAQLVTIGKIAEGHTAMALSAEAILYALNGKHVHHPIYDITEESGKRDWKENVSTSVANEIQLFPNPTTGQITVSFPTETKQKTTLVFFNIQGSQVSQIEIPARQKIHTIELNLSAGLYIYSMYQGADAVQVDKLMIIK